MQGIMGLLACLIVSPLGLLYAVSALVTNPGKRWKWLPFLVLSLGLAAYAYEPTAEIDLSRYFAIAKDSTLMSLPDAIDYFMESRPQDPRTDVYIIESWILTKMGIIHMIPMVTVVFVYGIAFYLTADIAGRYNVTEYIPVIILLQFSLLPYVSIISNVRNIWAFSLVILAVYWDLVCKKHGPIVWLTYILPLFIHPSSILLVVLRFFAGLKQKFLALFFGMAITFPAIIDFLYSIRGIFEGFGLLGQGVSLGLWKIYLYLHDTGETDWATHVSNSIYMKFNKLFLILLAVILCLLILKFVRKYTKPELKKFLNYELLLCILTISFTWFVVPHYWRFACAYDIALPVVMVPLLAMKGRRPFWVMAFTYGILCYIPVGLALQLWGSQYSTDYVQWIGSFCTTNVFSILWDMIYGTIIS